MNNKFPFLSTEYAVAPQNIWQGLRESDPVFYSQEYGFWVISKHADILEMLKDPQTYSSSFGPSAGLNAEEGVDDSGVGFLPLLSTDPPEHTRLRSIFAKAFTPKRIAEMEPTINRIAKELIDNLRQKIEKGESIDFVEDYASPLPVFTIAMMMGIPLSERHRLKMWSDSMAIGTGDTYSAEQQANSQQEMATALKEIVERARENPQEDTLIAAMLQATDDEDKLTEDELHGLCKLLWIAGNETTTNLISNSIVFLKDNTPVLDEIRANKSLIPEFVEEMLRYDGPVTGLFRTATRDIEFRGQQISKGDAIWLLFSSGNLDSDNYVNADKFDLHRKQKDHLALGKGIHFCMGSVLARLEARIAFEWIVDFLPYCHLQFEQGKRIPVPILRGWLKMPMTVDRAALNIEPKA